MNASVPVVFGNEVLITECYGIGSSLLKFSPGAHEVVWKDDKNRRSKAMLAHWNTPIYLDGHFYGCSGRHTENAELRCVDWEDGRREVERAGTLTNLVALHRWPFHLSGRRRRAAVTQSQPAKIRTAGRGLSNSCLRPTRLAGVASPTKMGVGRVPGSAAPQISLLGCSDCLSWLALCPRRGSTRCLEVIPGK